MTMTGSCILRQSYDKAQGPTEGSGSTYTYEREGSDKIPVLTSKVKATIPGRTGRKGKILRCGTFSHVGVNFGIPHGTQSAVRSRMEGSSDGYARKESLVEEERRYQGTMTKALVYRSSL